MRSLSSTISSGLPASSVSAPDRARHAPRGASAAWARATLLVLLSGGNARELSAAPQDGSVDRLRALVARAESRMEIPPADWIEVLGRLPAGESAAFASRCRQGRVRADGAPDSDSAARIRSDLERAMRGAGGSLATDTPTSRRVGLELLAELGTGADVGQVMALAAPPANCSHEAKRGLETAAVKALESIAVRASDGLETLERAYVDERSGRLVLSALERMGEPRALRSMATLLGRIPELDALALALVVTVAEDARAPLGEASLPTIRVYLEHERAAVRASAATALGRLDDVGAVQGLLLRLSDTELAVRQAASLALRRITGRAMDGGVERWRSWHSESVRAWAAEGQSLLTQAARPEQELETLRGILARLRGFPLERATIAPRILPLLAHSDTRVVLEAVRTLVALGVDALASIRAIQSTATTHPNPGIRAEATRGLIAVTRVRDPQKLRIDPEPR